MALLTRPNIQSIGQPPAIHTESFRLAQSTIAAGLTIVAGNNVVTVSDVSGFVENDLVVVSEIMDSGTSSKNGYFTISSIAGSQLTLSLVPRPGGQIVGAVFTAGRTEITGQTRLPNIPNGAIEAEITLTMTTEFFTALADPLASMHTMATFLSSGIPLAYSAIKTSSSLDIDLIYQTGRPLTHAGTVSPQARIDLLNTRIFSHTPMALAPILYVEYR